MNREQFLKAARDTFDEAQSILDKKNSDYALASDPFKNFRNAEAVGVSLERGILVRMMDKMSRLGILVDNSEGNAVKDESIDDTLLDIINYAAIIRVHRSRLEQLGPEKK